MSTTDPVCFVNKAPGLNPASYSPGAITGLILYIPLIAYALRKVLPRVSRGHAVGAVALGAAIHAGVMLLAANPSLIPSP